MPVELILASSSPRRRQLLRQAGFAFQAAPPQVEEPDPGLFDDPEGYVHFTAWLKARDVARRQSGYILAADTVAVLGNCVIGKPADRSDAERILRSLSGQDHVVLTGLVCWDTETNCSSSCVSATKVHMKELSNSELVGYLDSNQWVGKAGAYGIQDDDPYVRIIDGDFENVVGLPVSKIPSLLDGLRSFRGGAS